MIGLELIGNALDVENELVLLEAIWSQIVNQRKIRVRSARRVGGRAHVPGKIFPAVDLNPAFLPCGSVRPGINRFHQRPRPDVARITDDWRAADLPIAGWKRRRIEWSRRNPSWRWRNIWSRRLISRRLRVLRERVKQTLSKPVRL